MSNKTCFPWSVVKSVEMGIKRFPPFGRGMGQATLFPRSMILMVESWSKGCKVAEGKPTNQPKHFQDKW